VAEYQTPEFHPAFEEYCEAIWELKEDDVSVIQARVAERLGVSRPAVSEMIKRMQAEGFVKLDGTTINLTADGLRLAEQVVRRHRLAERLLTDILGLSWADAHVEAGKWEHVISAPVESAINRLLDNPTTCPHGNPIPGSSYAPPDLVALTAIPVGGAFTVTRIPEELEFTPGILNFLEDAAVQPDHTGQVTAVSPDGTVTVEIDGRHVGIGAFAAARILVISGSTPAQASAEASATPAPASAG
jgi:DtxR family transcriptional regulator, Mn-dependent transcriptional regulator